MTNFNYDLTKMKAKVNSLTVIKPVGLKGKELAEWLLRYKIKD